MGTQPTKVAGTLRRAVRLSAFNGILGGRHMECAYYFDFCRLCQWGFEHHKVNHGNKEYARDDDGDGFCEVHVNTMEGFWSLLRSWLRPHRGISQEKLPKRSFRTNRQPSLLEQVKTLENGQGLLGYVLT